MQTSLFKQADFYGFVHNFLISRLFSTRKVPNRSSRYDLSNGQRVVSRIFLFFRSKPWSNLVNLGQLWSNLVKPPQTSRNALPAMFWEFLSPIKPFSSQTSSVWAVSFCMPTPEKIWEVKIGLWQRPLLITVTSKFQNPNPIIAGINLGFIIFILGLFNSVVTKVRIFL